MNREEKNEEVETLTDYFAKAAVALAAEYRGLTVAQMNALRKTLRESGCVGKVSKNTLVRLSLKKAHKESGAAAKLGDALTGPSIMVFSMTDAIAPARVLAKFAKENEKLQIKGAILDGQFYDTKGVEELSKLPSKEELFAKLLMLINGPATKLLRVIKEPGAKLARAVDAYRQKLEKGA